MLKPGVFARDIGIAVDAYFGRSKKIMPHSLGHGIGLSAHEVPTMRSWADNEWILEPGMIITLEPGLYDPVQGGCRLENDILITMTGAEALTDARIIRL
jgi:Xaa-Pro dipeptidase